MTNSDPLSSLDDASRERVERMFRGCKEIIGVEHIASIVGGGVSHAGDDVIRGYVGIEPSGKAHLGWVVIADTIRNLLDEGVNVLIWLADWHAWVNDKFDRDMEKISLTADYMTEVFRALLDFPEEGDAAGQLRFMRASELMSSGIYWERVLRCSKNMSLNRVRRTFSIMGRDEDSSEHDLSAFFYPAMQAADIFELNIDVAFGGMDQRKAHMYMREVADKNHWTKATCAHTPMLSGLKGRGGGRMDSFDHKMSKSDPNNAILLHDNAKNISKKFRKAFLEVGSDDSPVFEIAKHIVLPNLGELKVEPNPEYGSPSTWNDIDTFVAAVGRGEIHPFDAKMAVASGLSEVLAPISIHFEEKPDLLEQMNKMTGSQ